MRVRLYCSLKNRLWLQKVAVMIGAVFPDSLSPTCPHCGTSQLRELRKLDRIDSVSRLPWSTLQKFFGGKLYRCRTCRLQFYDCRSVGSRAA
jgi:hypothetical protein